MEIFASNFRDTVFAVFVKLGKKVCTFFAALPVSMWVWYRTEIQDARMLDRGIDLDADAQLWCFCCRLIVPWSVALQADKCKYDIQTRRTCPES